jgi:hypothetical protein
MFYRGHLVYLDKGYPSIKVAGRNVTVHKLVWEAAHSCRVPRGFIIHHRDEDKTNFADYNLELLSIVQHAAKHNDIRDRARKLRETIKL